MNILKYIEKARKKYDFDHIVEGYAYTFSPTVHISVSIEMFHDNKYYVEIFDESGLVAADHGYLEDDVDPVLLGFIK